MHARKIIRMKMVKVLTGLSESSIWRREHDGVFPMRSNLGGRSVGWFEHEVVDWLESRERKQAKNQPIHHKECV